MRYGILGDIHGNLEAFDVALEVLADQRIDRYLQVGDVVGYGADPGTCIQRLQDLQATVVAGNHDWGVVGKLDPTCFNSAARACIRWTRRQLTPVQMQFLESLTLLEVIEDEVTLVHASPDQPELFDYIMDEESARNALGCFETPVCFMGHSHSPLGFLMDDELYYTEESELSLADVNRALINVGSVGQPRDDDPRCAFAVYDSLQHSYSLFRRPYDIESAANKILAAGLPKVLADRLSVGQ